MSRPGPRLAPLPPGHSPELADQFASFRKTLGFVPNSVLTMQRKPGLVRAFVQMQAAIWSPDSQVDRGLKRLIAFAASRAAQDAYSMAHTASGALHFGIAPDKVAALADFRGDAAGGRAARGRRTASRAARLVRRHSRRLNFARPRAPRIDKGRAARPAPATSQKRRAQDLGGTTCRFASIVACSCNPPPPRPAPPHSRCRRSRRTRRSRSA